MLSNIFGVKPTDAVFLPSAPYAVRFIANVSLYRT